jgi:hypothetical protein
MIYDHGEKGVEVSYTTSKADVYSASNNAELMKFIIDNRPIVVYQFWIISGKDGKPDEYKMLYSKAVPSPDTSPSDI